MKISALVFILLIVFCPIRSFSQILYSPEEIIKEYGSTYMTGIEKGKEYMLYVYPFYTKTSGDYYQQKLIFLEETPSGDIICTRFSILEPSSETQINRDIYNRDLRRIGRDQWFDESTGIYYKIEKTQGFCMITAWIGEAEPGELDNNLFKI